MALPNPHALPQLSRNVPWGLAAWFTQGQSQNDESLVLWIVLLRGGCNICLSPSLWSCNDPVGFSIIPWIWAGSDLVISPWVLPYLLLVVFLILKPSLNTDLSETLMMQTEAKDTLSWPYHCSLSLNHPPLSPASLCLPCLAVCMVFV